MSIKSISALIYAKIHRRKIKKWASKPILTQKKVFDYLIKEGQQTLFGTDHHFNTIKTHEDFVRNVPIRDYEGIRSYIDKAVNGEEDILWHRGRTRPYAIWVFIASRRAVDSGKRECRRLCVSVHPLPLHVR